MSNRSVITLRVASQLKNRLAAVAQSEGVSMNQLISYFLTENVTAMEMRQRIDARRERIKGKSEDELRAAALAMFDTLKERQADRQDEINVPDWDRWPNDGDPFMAEAAQPKQGNGRVSSHRYQPISRPSLAVHEPEADYDVGDDQ